jgi:hypothetical protein
VRIDHVILATVDLDSAAERLLAEHGLASIPGGEHAGFGTANRIVPLGEDYIELMGFADPELARQNPLGQRLAERDGGWLGWCVRTDDVVAVGERLGSPVISMSREKPDRSVLRWRLSGLEISLAEPGTPFFIQWDDMNSHPGTDAAQHVVEPTGIASIEVAGDRARIESLLGDSGIPVRFLDGSPGVRRVRISTASGEIILE